MNGPDRTWRRTAIGLTLLTTLTLAGGREARADRIVLRGGGTIPGKAVPDPTDPGRVTVIMERGKTPLRLSKAQVVKVIPEPGPLDEYLPKREAAPQSAEGRYELGLWCESNKLPDLAQIHFEEAVELDPTFGPAHEKLGHQEVNGVWLSGDGLREAQGLVKYRGKWMTAEERDDLTRRGSRAAEESAWARRIKGWRDAIAFGAEDRRREAESQLMAISEPAAVKPLVRVLGPDEPPFRGLLARVLGAIPGPESVSALVSLLLAEETAEVRGSIINELTRRNDPKAAADLTRALRSKNTAVVNRAAWGLSHLNAVKAVPSLVNALVTRFTRMEIPPDPGGAPGAGTAGLPPQVLGAPYPAPPIAYNGSSVAYLTGPAVGPGAVAFGATSSPVVPIPGSPLPGITSPGAFFGGPSMSGLNLTGSGLGGSRGPLPRPVTYSFRNTEVLASLIKLTGQDFGYDVTAWQRWLTADFKPEAEPARRVPQP